ncbi:DUF6624 domain-containing protein [Leadbetterella sp. DM7]|uniref:DUF6624 domain-containing protein n=1 Tax=Leadbetterella sp. DM7 TaxID=3235085 RepID=UPI00349F0028
MRKWKYILPCTVLMLTGCTKRLSEKKKTELQDELKRMVAVDQEAAWVRPEKYKDYSGERWEQFKDSVFTTHTLRLEEIYRKHGFMGFDKVGEEGSNHFWLMVQHADKYPDFQKKILRAMDKEVKKGNANPRNYAYLYDRVRINAGQKQRFGTQVDYDVDGTGRARPKSGLSDSTHVDEIRKQYQLEPLKEYLNMMTEMHYEMNKKHYESKGIMKPDLY